MSKRTKEAKEKPYIIPPQTNFEKKLQTFCRWFIGGVYGLSFGIMFYSIVDSLVKRITQ